VFRFDPEKETESRYDVFTVEVEPNMRLLDCLNKIRWEQDPGLSYRWSCSHGICGSDGMTINGTATLACQKLVRDYDEAEVVTVEPLAFYPIVKDLVVDMEPFFERMRAIHPESWGTVNPVDVAHELGMSKAEHTEIVDAVKCVMCGCCTASCPVNLEEDPEYIGPAASLRATRYIFDTRLGDSEERMEITQNILKTKTRLYART
jgi:succinate dehydrogenase / fumarate reductase iron-sulfur subunit